MPLKTQCVVICGVERIPYNIWVARKIGFGRSILRFAPDNKCMSKKMKETKKTLIQKIRAHMKSKEMKQRELAKKLGIKQPRVSELLDSEREQTSLEAIFRVMDVLGLRYTVSAVE